MHTKETRLGGMFRVGLPARSCGRGAEYFACLRTHLLYIRIEIKIPGGVGRHEVLSAKIVSENFYMSQATIRNGKVNVGL